MQLPIFNSNSCYKLYVYKVDPKYNGFIDNDLLIQLDAIINLKNKILRTENTEIPIIYNDSHYKIQLSSSSKLRIALPTTQNSGDAIFN